MRLLTRNVREGSTFTACETLELNASNPRDAIILAALARLFAKGGELSIRIGDDQPAKLFEIVPLRAGE